MHKCYIILSVCFVESEEIMKKIILSVFVIILTVNAALADTLKFAQITDVHTSEQGVRYQGRNLDNSISNFQNAVDKINADKTIEYVFFTGDAVDVSDEKLYQKFFEVANKLNKPYYITFGNHDVNWGINKHEALNIIKNNSYAHQNSANYAVSLNDKFTAVMLDGTYDKKFHSKGYFSKKTLNWLDKILKENENKYVLIFQHFPVAEPASDKKYKYPHKISNKHCLIRHLKKYDNVLIVSSGHYHVKGEFKKYGIQHYSTPAMFLTPSYYRITTIDYDKKKINDIKSELKLND